MTRPVRLVSGRRLAASWSVLTVGVGVALAALAIVGFAVTGAAVAALTPAVVGVALCGLATLCPIGERPSSLLLFVAGVLAASCTVAVIATIIGSSTAFGVSHDRYQAIVVTNVIMLALLVTYLAVCSQQHDPPSAGDVTPEVSDGNVHPCGGAPGGLRER